MGVFQLRMRPSSRGAVVPLRRLLDADRALDLAGVLVMYDRVLSVLDALHTAGRAHGAVTADVIGIWADGAVTLKEPASETVAKDQPLVFELPGHVRSGVAAARDVRALTLVMVDAITCGSAGATIPVAARELVHRGLGSDASPSASAIDMQSDTEEAGRAFFGDGWRDAGAAALASALSQLVGEAPAGSSRRRRRLAGAAIGATVLLAAPVLVGRAVASNPSFTGHPGQAGVSSAIVTAPGDALVSPSTAEPGGVQGTVAPSASPSHSSSNTRRRPTVAPTAAVSPRHGATSELTPPISLAPTTATPAPSAATPSPTPSSTPAPSATPTATPTPSPTPSPTAKPTARPAATPKPTATASPTATPKPTPKPTP